MEAVKVGYFGNAGYTLQRGNEIVSCDDVMIMELDDEFLVETFEDWKQAALEGEEGYEYFSV